MIKQIIVLALAVSGCAKNTPETDARTQARHAANAYLKEIDPRELEKPVSVTDEGETWLVVYHGPQDSAGGDRLVSVDKHTMKVVDSVAWQ